MNTYSSCDRRSCRRFHRNALLVFALLGSIIGSFPDAVAQVTSQEVQQASPASVGEVVTADPATTTTAAAIDLRAGGRLKIFNEPANDRGRLLADYAEAIRDQPFKFGDVGAVLEALAVQGMQHIYPPPAHQIVSGIEYSDATGRTLGELDIVVFLTASGDAIMISEVKLSSNLERAGRKADSQIRRFQNAVSNGQVARLRHKGNGQVYRVENFENVLRYGKVGSRGALEHGFDWEVDLTRDEGDVLQRMLRRAPAR